MLTKIETQEIMTLQEMMDKYEDKWFRYVPVGDRDLINPVNNKGYVVYIADEKQELRGIEESRFTSICGGRKAYEPLSYGGFIERHD